MPDYYVWYKHGEDFNMNVGTSIYVDSTYLRENKTETFMRNLGLPYYTIDVCINNCMLFWKEDEKEDKCRFCSAQRWKPMDDYRRRTKVPYSCMWYLPIGDRLKRMYQSHKTTAAMRWHAEHQSKEEEMNHPSNAAK